MNDQTLDVTTPTTDDRPHLTANTITTTTNEEAICTENTIGVAATTDPDHPVIKAEDTATTVLTTATIDASNVEGDASNVTYPEPALTDVLQDTEVNAANYSGANGGADINILLRQDTGDDTGVSILRN